MSAVGGGDAGYVVEQQKEVTLGDPSDQRSAWSAVDPTSASGTVGPVRHDSELSAAGPELDIRTLGSEE
jgi:hypothetical protein